MRVSYSTLLLLAEEGDDAGAAAIMTRAWKEESGILWESDDLRVYYRFIPDYFVMHTSDGRTIAAPTRWDQMPQSFLVLSHPIIQDPFWYQKAR
jgi:hypothetical protein